MQRAKEYAALFKASPGLRSALSKIADLIDNRYTTIRGRPTDLENKIYEIACGALKKAKVAP